jgi:hypothetical protein
MAILMRYGKLEGDSLYEGYEGFFILTGLSWGLDWLSNIGSGRADVKAVACSARAGSTGALLLHEALGGRPSPATLVVGTWSGAEGVEPLLLATLDDAQVTGYASSHLSDTGTESFVVSFTAIHMSFTQNLPGPDGRMARRNAAALSVQAGRVQD